MDKVKVISMTNHRIGVKSNELRYSRQWPSKGSVVAIDRDILEELMYDPGFKYMIDTGMLYIEDLQVKKDLGIEPVEATEPVNIKMVPEKEMVTYMTTMTLDKFKEAVSKLTKEQIDSLISLAINKKYMDYDKCKYLKELTGRDIIQAIRLQGENEEV